MPVGSRLQRAGFGRTPERRRHDRLFARRLFGVQKLWRTSDVRAVLEAYVQRQLAAGDRNLDATAEEGQRVAVVESAAGDERLAVERDAAVAADRLRERRAVEQIDQHYRAAARARQTDIAVAARPETQRQGARGDATLAFYVADNQMVKAQIGSSLRTTTGCMSSSGATRNSTRTSRNPGRLPTAT